MRDPCQLHPPRALADSVEELNSMMGWFHDENRPSKDNEPPFVIVVDNFYDEPLKVRDSLRQMQYIDYSPPDEKIVGKAVAAAYVGKPRGAWKATAFTVFMGARAQNPFVGARCEGPEAFSSLRWVLGQREKIDEITFYDSNYNDAWNLAGHLMDGNWKTGNGSIHHHYKQGDVEPRGWSGVVYLTPDAPSWSGTTIWLSKETGKCIAGYGATFEKDVTKFKLALFVENKFNRLVLFRENVLHCAERGFGYGKDARLTQTFFFRAQHMN